jgi:IS5 family transposase
MKPRIIDRAYKNKPLTEKQKKKNNTKSRTRCRCEHVFGYVTNSMGDFFTRNIGFERVRGDKSDLQYLPIRTNCAAEIATHAGLMKKMI